jgi:hypothetical protein
MLSYEQVYGLSVLACVFYAWLIFIGRMVYTWWTTSGMRNLTTVERLAYVGAGDLSEMRPSRRLALWLACTMFLTIVGFVPVLNVIVALVGTVAMFVLCVALLLDLD